MKRLALTILILSFLFTGIVNGNDLDSKKVLEPAPWTVLFTYRSSSEGMLGELIVLENCESEDPKVFRVTIYTENREPQIQKIFFGAIYISEKEPKDFIEIIKKEKNNSVVITEEKMEEIISLIRNSNEWIILDDYEKGKDSFKLLQNRL